MYLFDQINELNLIELLYLFVNVIAMLWWK